ncbi:MAG: hypothetical protein PHT69_10390 [Bacteroidales bacterium]|nr:hypothetical protein [Bacteroidales bacterium]
MSIIQQLKDNLGYFFLKQELKKFSRKKKPMSFDQIKTVGILYVVPSEKDFHYINDFVKYLQQNNKTVKALGYTNTPYIPHYCFPKLTYDYFSSKEINWYGKPKSKFAEDFMKSDFDLLIDLSTKPIFTINYISYLSSAYFKTGILNDNNVQHFDLMLDIKEDTDLNDFIHHIQHYLININISND